MTAPLDDLAEAYLDGSLDAAGAERLATALRAGGAGAQALRTRLALPGLIALALDPADGRAVARAVGERLRAESEASAFRRAVRRRIAPRRRAPAAWRGWAAAAAVLALLAAGALLLARPAPAPAGWILAGAIQAGGAELALADGAELALADGTRLAARGGATVLPDAAGDRLELRAGALLASVRPRPAGRPLALATAEAEVVVVGTRFVLARDAAGTRLDMHEGRVRLVRRAGGAAEEVGAGARVAVAAAPAWTPLFPAGLAGWRSEHGRWEARDGVVAGGGAAGRSRLASVASLGDLELECRLRIAGGLRRAEVQVGDYNWFVTVPGRADGGWVRLALAVRDGRLAASADGAPLAAEAGAGGPPRRGSLAFYVPPGATLEIADGRLRAAP